MFKITPINDTELQKKYSTECGTDYREGFFAYAMTDADSGQLMGMAQFEIDGEYGYISDLRPKVGYSDFEAMFILGRATMNFIDLCGSHKCRAAIDAADERLLKSIGFKLNESRVYECDMTGMFDGHCDGHPVKL
ncbi:MAG: hypothetical protein IJD51_04335 [Clostridia bacterium]|nr:hypothetical protein [Clostridia bacterium]